MSRIVFFFQQFRSLMHQKKNSLPSPLHFTPNPRRFLWTDPRGSSRRSSGSSRRSSSSSRRRPQIYFPTKQLISLCLIPKHFLVPRSFMQHQARIMITLPRLISCYWHLGDVSNTLPECCVKNKQCGAKTPILLLPIAVIKASNAFSSLCSLITIFRFKILPLRALAPWYLHKASVRLIKSAW